MTAAVSQNIGRERTRRESSSFFENKDADNNIEMIKRLIKEIEVARVKYPHLFMKRNDFESVISSGSDPGVDSPSLGKSYSCGAGRTSLYLDSSGDIHLCAIAPTCGVPSLGNMQHNSLEEIMSSPLARFVSKVPAPGLAICSSKCKHFSFCGDCIARGYAKFIEDGTNCKWARGFAKPIKQENQNSLHVLIS